MPLPEGHRFPLPKYSRLHQRVIEAQLPGVELLPSTPATEAELRLVHTEDYVRRVLNGELTPKETRRIGFPWSPEMALRSRASTGGTIEAARAALADGRAAHLAGGTHHAYPDHGEGYCVFNDVAVAARVMQQEARARRIVMIDLDVHQGNGTAAIFADDPSVFTFSVHGQKNFPYDKERGSLDIALPDGADDAAFLNAVYTGLPQAIRQAQADLAFYIAGADPYLGDRLGRLKMTKPGLAERDRFVLQTCRDVSLPTTVVMGGGYARDVQDVVDIHAETIRIAATF